MKATRVMAFHFVFNTTHPERGSRIQIEDGRHRSIRTFPALVRQHRPLSQAHVIRIWHAAIEVQFFRSLKWEPGLKS